MIFQIGSEHTWISISLKLCWQVIPFRVSSNEKTVAERAVICFYCTFKGEAIMPIDASLVQIRQIGCFSTQSLWRPDVRSQPTTICYTLYSLTRVRAARGLDLRPVSHARGASRATRRVANHDHHSSLVNGVKYCGSLITD